MKGRTSPPGEGDRVDPRALTREQASRLLGVPPELIARHIAAGAPTNADGSLHLVHYAAWLIRRLSPP